ncbi:NucA/NucB deoxyribonuclease domain-containing protein [Amycolatopsis sp. A1MSW2902]|uniref:NucA/NucB deoxyribonuclease domain-containing protein n=1 Tax=Amycolatopsis sp. A1MSW2902 TaxID=687413 RepID=UPI00307D0ECB
MVERDSSGGKRGLPAQSELGRRQSLKEPGAPKAAKQGRAAVGGSSLDPACADGYYNPNRFTSCSDDGWTVTQRETVNGVTSVTGSLSFSARTSASFAEGSGATPSWDLDVEITVGAASGTLANGLNGNMYSGCRNNASVCSTSQLAGSNGEYEPVSLTRGKTVKKWYTQYSAGMDQGAVISLDKSLGYGLILYPVGNPVQIDDFKSNQMYGRCDHRPNRYGAGCVDYSLPGYVNYNSVDNPDVGPVAQHVYDAIRTLPSHWGRPGPGSSTLNRQTNAAKIADNRRIACGSVATGPGESCDEYPMASTYQGGDGAAPNDRSTKIVPQNANDIQGGLTSAYYDYYRIIDFDDFYVQAVLPNGSTAW